MEPASEKAQGVAEMLARLRTTPLDGYLLIGAAAKTDEFFEIFTGATAEVKRELEDYVLAMAARIQEERNR